MQPGSTIDVIPLEQGAASTTQMTDAILGALGDSP